MPPQVSGNLTIGGAVSPHNICRVSLAIVCAFSLDGQDMVTPIVITLLFSSSPLFFVSTIRPNKRFSQHVLSSSTSQVIFTGTSVPPLQLSSWRELQHTSYFQDMTLVFHLWKWIFSSLQVGHQCVSTARFAKHYVMDFI